MVLSTCQDVDHLSLLTVQSGGVEALTDLYHSGCMWHPGLDHVPQLPPPDMKRFKTLRLLFISFFNNPYGIWQGKTSTLKFKSLITWMSPARTRRCQSKTWGSRPPCSRPPPSAPCYPGSGPWTQIIVTLTNQRPVFRSRDQQWGQFWGHMTCIDQSEASIEVTWPTMRPVLRT